MNAETRYSENRFHPGRVWAEMKNLVIDLKYGESLLGTVRSTKQGHTFASNSDYAVIEWLVRSIENEVGADDVIVDVGCGKGRALNGFHYYFNQCRNRNIRLIGIEYEQQLAAQTKQRLAEVAGVEVVNADATEFLPPDAKFVYMFNPFSSAEIFSGFMRNFIRTAEASGSSARLLYYCPRMIAHFREDERFRVDIITNSKLVPWKVDDLYRTAAVISFAG
jgi:SAM-dependent methyltransferase